MWKVRLFYEIFVDFEICGDRREYRAETMILREELQVVNVIQCSLVN